MPAAPSPVATALAGVVRELPGGGEARPGQVVMAEAVGDAIASGAHLVVRAGTGTGKTLGYLVPAIRSGKRVVVATATRALQDQLAAKDLPFLDEHLDRPFSWAVLKGRSNYACVQRLAEVARPADGDGTGPGDQMALDGLAERADPDELTALAAWAATSPTGDRAELPVEPSEAAWGAISTGSRDCPGAARCPRGDRCFAEAARARAAEADVVVVNLYLYGLDLGADGAILPDHDVAVVDEAHLLDDVISATAGVELGPGRFTQLGRVLRGILAGAETTIAGVMDGAGLLSGALAGHRDKRLTAPLPADLAGALAAARSRVEAAQAALRNIPVHRGRRRHEPGRPGPPGGHRPARRPRRGGGPRRRPRPVRDRPRARPVAAPRAARRGRAAGRAAVVAPHRGADERDARVRASVPTSGCRSRPVTCWMSAARSTTRPTASSTARSVCRGRPTPGGPTPPSTSWPCSSTPRAGAPSPCSPATRP